MDNIRLPVDKLAKSGQKKAAVAATLVADAGGSPRAQIDAARKESTRALNYLPHQGKRERERRIRALEKAAARAAAKENGNG